MLNQNLKQQIIEELAKARDNFSGSDAKFAVSLGISAAQYSRIKRGELDRVISDDKWITIARNLGINPQKATKWITANTPVFQYITAQLEFCQKEATATLLCDLADIGKTYTATIYAKNNKNVVMVDCSQVKTKQALIRYIAKGFGVGYNGKYAETYADLVFYLKTIDNPLIILDEAGDLQYDAFLEIKALWNATEGSCGFYMMGAEGLKAKFQRALSSKKVGYAEIFSRFGHRYCSVIPAGGDDKLKIAKTNAALIIKANAPKDADIQRLLRATLSEDGMPSLRRIYKELTKNN